MLHWLLLLSLWSSLFSKGGDKMFTAEKPGTPEELYHVGVLGMKWGVHRSEETHQFNEKFKTNKRRSNEILRARKATRLKARQIRATSNPEKKAVLKAAFLKNPDRATAMRLRRGEK